MSSRDFEAGLTVQLIGHLRQWFTDILLPVWAQLALAIFIYKSSGSF